MNPIIRERLGIIVPLALFVLFFVIYSVAWFRGATVVREEIAAFAAREAAAGRSFTYDRVRTAGYPLMLRGEVENVAWTAPGVGAFRAGTVVLAAVPYDADRIVLSPRGPQRLEIRGSAYDLDADDLRFNLERDFVAVEGHGIDLVGAERTIAVKDLIANQEKVADGLAIAVSVKGLALGDDVGTTLPYLDLAASRQDGGLTIAGLALGVGRADDPSPTQLAGSGDINVDSEGRVNGTFDLRFRNEGPLLELLGEANAIDEGVVGTARMMLGLMTESGTKEVLLPLNIREGDVKLGIIPLGTIPPLTP